MADTIKQAELKTSYDALKQSDPTKAVGHIKNLIPTEGSCVNPKQKTGFT